MGPLLILAFIGIPILEITLFIKVGGWIGLWPTIFLVIITAVMGTVLIRAQGLSLMQEVQQKILVNQSPGQEIFSGLCLLISGFLLLTPGFLTDFLGLFLFIPSFRIVVAKLINKMVFGSKKSSFSGEAKRKNDHVNKYDVGDLGEHRSTGSIIDGNYEDLTEMAGDDKINSIDKN